MLSFTGSQHYIDTNATEDDATGSSSDRTPDTSVQRHEHRSPSGRKPRSSRSSQESDPDRNALNEIITVTQEGQRRSSREHQRTSQRSGAKRMSRRRSNEESESSYSRNGYSDRLMATHAIQTADSSSYGSRNGTGRRSAEILDDSDASDEERALLEANHEDGNTTVTGFRASGAGSRRGSQNHYHHHCQHHHHHHLHHLHPTCNASLATLPSNARNNHPTHARNFSSPSLLDSLTSHDPLLSPIQTYFGSDPNSPATSFALPRHDNYSHLSIDPSSSTMDGYHGFATHPWSEQSSTPSLAFSHRWTRRSSQSDAYPSRPRSDSTPRQRHSTIVYSQTFAPAAMDQPWDATSSSIPNLDLPAGNDDPLEDDQDSTVSEDMMQDSNGETALDEDNSGCESTHESHFGYSVDEDDDMNETEDYSYDYRASSVDGENDSDDEESYMGGATEEDMEDPLNHEMMDHEDNLHDDDYDDDDEDDRDNDDVPVEHTSGGRLLDQMMTRDIFLPATAAPESHSIALPSSGLPHRVPLPEQDTSTESDEALARRLQDEEYAALLGERVSLVSPLPS